MSCVCRYALRYPLKRADFDASTMQSARIRPTNKVVSVSHAIPTNDSHYNQVTVPSAKLKEITHESSAPPLNTGYAIGKLKDGEFPVCDSSRCRPDASVCGVYLQAS